MLFVEKLTNRKVSMKFCLTAEEREFLRDEAQRRGVTVLTLVRRCIREQLIPPPFGDSNSVVTPTKTKKAS